MSFTKSSNRYWESCGPGAASVYVELVIGELVPKAFALRYTEAVALRDEGREGRIEDDAKEADEREPEAREERKFGFGHVV